LACQWSFNPDLICVERSMERDKFMSPVEAKAFGLIDNVLVHPPKYDESEEKQKESAAANWLANNI